MGTHPIFESDFDCLTELKCFLDWLPVSLEDVTSSSKPNLVFCTLHQDGLTPTILLTETCGLVLPFLFASPLLLSSPNCKTKRRWLSPRNTLLSSMPPLKNPIPFSK